MNDAILQILHNLAVTYDTGLAQCSNAEPFYRKWVEITAATYGDSHAETSKAKHLLAEFIARLKS